MKLKSNQMIHRVMGFNKRHDWPQLCSVLTALALNLVTKMMVWPIMAIFSVNLLITGRLKLQSSIFS